MAETPTRKFELRKIFLKDMSFESPLAPDVFHSLETQPMIEMQANVAHRNLEGDLYEVVLVITVSGKVGDQSVFLVEVQQAGMFEIAGFDEMSMALEIACPNILLPFAREAVCDIVGKGGFPQLLLSPINFEAIYYRRRQSQESAENEAHSTAGNGGGSEAVPQD